MSQIKVGKKRRKRELTQFGRWVKKRLLDKGMESKELCREIGMNDVYFSRILHGDACGEKYIEQITEKLKDESNNTSTYLGREHTS